MDQGVERGWDPVWVPERVGVIATRARVPLIAGKEGQTARLVSVVLGGRPVGA